MDCPRCGRADFSSETPCTDCGYRIPDDAVPGDNPADMSLDELNRMLGELGIEPISDVAQVDGKEVVTALAGRAGVHTGRTDREDAAFPRVLEPVTGDVQDTTSTKSVPVEGHAADLPVESPMPEVPDPQDGIDLSDDNDGNEGVELDHMSENALNGSVEGLSPADGKTPSPKRKLKDARLMAKPALSIANFLKALAGWLPALLARQKTDRRKRPAVGSPNPGGDFPPNHVGEAAPDAEGTILSEPYPMDDEVVPVAEKMVSPPISKREKAKPLSSEMKNLIFRIAVPLIFVMLMAVLLQVVLGLRERRMEPDMPTDSEKLQYEPWTPVADVPPVPVTIEAEDGVFLP